MFKDMIDCCLQRDPAKRPTAKALLKHPFLQDDGSPIPFVSVFAHVPPVNLRDKSAQLRARGLPVPATSEEAGAEGNDGAEIANRSFLSHVLTEDDENEDTSDSWDFRLIIC